MSLHLAADVGGTFTDIVARDDDGPGYVVTKVATTPDDIALGVIQGFDEVTSGDYRNVGSIVYGTTAGLNAVLQRSGARTALVTTRGFRDIYEIARGNHPDMYNSHYRKPAPLIERRDIFEVDERVDASGRVVTAVDVTALTELADRLAGYEAVAVAFLHSYANPTNEALVADALQRLLATDVAITTSSAIAPELGEYERLSTTVLNAYMAPPIRRYVTRLRELLTRRGFLGEVSVMQSNGGMLTEDVAFAQPVRIVMSGPVGGVIGARVIAAELDEPDLIAIDMGGTSFDVSLVVDGRPELATDSQIEGFPILAPTVQTLSVGAGGGSIAWTQAGGMRVGPQSSGAVPGPVCYDRGGKAPTTTDANVVLERLPPTRFLDGRMALRSDLATQTLDDYGRTHGLSGIEAAAGVVEITNATMSDAIRQITLRRGLDPREFTLLAFGGAGPLHAVELAEELDIEHVLVPRNPGAFSAWGMLHAELTHDGVVTVLAGLAELTESALETAYVEARNRLDAPLVAKIVACAHVAEHRSLDLRYAGQKYTVNLATDGLSIDHLREAFEDRYRDLFGFASPDAEIEVVNARVSLIGSNIIGATGPQAPSSSTPQPHRPMDSKADERYRQRADLLAQEPVSGPMVITELTSTTFVPQGWAATVTANGTLSIRRHPPIAEGERQLA